MALHALLPPRVAQYALGCKRSLKTICWYQGVMQWKHSGGWGMSSDRDMGTLPQMKSWVLIQIWLMRLLLCADVTITITSRSASEGIAISSPWPALHIRRLVSVAVDTGPGGTAPAVEGTALAVEGTAPAVEGSALAGEGTALAVEGSALAGEGTAPAGEGTALPEDTVAVVGRQSTAAAAAGRGSVNRGTPFQLGSYMY